MRRRIGLTYEAEAENVTQEDIINKVLNAVQVPWAENFQPLHPGIPTGYLLKRPSSKSVFIF